MRKKHKWWMLAENWRWLESKTAAIWHGFHGASACHGICTDRDASVVNGGSILFEIVYISSTASEVYTHNGWWTNFLRGCILHQKHMFLKEPKSTVDMFAKRNFCSKIPVTTTVLLLSDYSVSYYQGSSKLHLVQVSTILINSWWCL